MRKPSDIVAALHAQNLISRETATARIPATEIERAIREAQEEGFREGQEAMRTAILERAAQRGGVVAGYVVAQAPILPFPVATAGAEPPVSDSGAFVAYSAWVDVRERLPDARCFCLVDLRTYPEVIWYNPDLEAHWQTFDGNILRVGVDFRFWHPLPAPPPTEEGEQSDV